MERKLTGNFEEENRRLHEILQMDRNFDIVYKPFTVAGRRAGIYFIDGFMQEAIMEKLMEFFYKLTPQELPPTAQEMLDRVIPYTEVNLLADEDLVLQNLLTGLTCLFIEGYTECLGIDCRTYPMRSVSEPEKDKAMRGSKDGFVETIVMNAALIRRRIRSPKLCMEILNAGKTSKTDIVLCYMEDRVDRPLLQEIEKRIRQIRVDALTMNQESLAECIY